MIQSIDVQGYGFYSDTTNCYIEYKKSIYSTGTTVILITDTGDEYSQKIGYDIQLPDDYDNTTFYWEIGNSGSTANQCWFANIHVYGIPYTDGPSLSPSESPIIVTTNSPTMEPTTMNPTTMNPTSMDITESTLENITEYETSSTMNPTSMDITKSTSDNMTVDSTINATSMDITESTSEKVTADSTQLENTNEPNTNGGYMGFSGILILVTVLIKLLTI